MGPNPLANVTMYAKEREIQVDFALMEAEAKYFK